MIKYISVLFTKHKKKLPKRFQGTILDEWIQYGFLTILSAWTFQGMLMLNWRETVIKLVLDVAITLALWMVGVPFLLAFFIAHTLNYMFNGQAKAVYNHMGAGNKSAKSFFNGTISMKKRIDTAQHIDAGIAYGSLSRGCYKPTSDIDIRIIPAKGEWNFWKTCFWAVKERSIAFATGYPLDMYVFTLPVVQKLMRSDELPIIVVERNKCAQEIYPDRVEWDEWCEVFVKEQNIKNI